jgi:hypothetical protein
MMQFPQSRNIEAVKDSMLDVILKLNGCVFDFMSSYDGGSLLYCSLMKTYLYVYLSIYFICWSSIWQHFGGTAITTRTEPLCARMIKFPL